MADWLEAAVTVYMMVGMFCLGVIVGVCAERDIDVPLRWRLLALFGWPVMLAGSWRPPKGGDNG